MAEDYSLLADLTGVAHALFVLFVVGGQVLILIGWARKWAWVRWLAFRVTHLAAIGFVVGEAWFGVPCPLTVLESHWRVLAGAAGYQTTFVAYWLDRLLYYQAPSWVFVVLYTAFAALVASTFAANPPKRRGR